jgi:hypothetical protein
MTRLFIELLMFLFYFRCLFYWYCLFGASDFFNIGSMQSFSNKFSHTFYFSTLFQKYLIFTWKTMWPFKQVNLKMLFLVSFQRYLDKHSVCKRWYMTFSKFPPGTYWQTRNTSLYFSLSFSPHSFYDNSQAKYFFILSSSTPKKCSFLHAIFAFWLFSYKHSCI